MDIITYLKTSRLLWVFLNTSNCGRNDSHSQLWRTTKNRQNVRGVSYLCLSKKEAGREDHKNIVLAVNLSEIQSDTENGGKGKGDLRIKAHREMFSFLFAGMVIVRMRPYGRR